MSATVKASVSHQLTLPEELILMLLNEESGYFYQVPGWNLHCALIGAVLAELSLQSRIDTDLESLFLLDPAETGDSTLDPILAAIADTPTQRSALYWIEALEVHAESIIEQTLERLVDLNILQRHSGGFWTLARADAGCNITANLKEAARCSLSRIASTTRSSTTKSLHREM